MPVLTVVGVGEFEVGTGKRLVNALVEDAGTDQLHACGGVRDAPPVALNSSAVSPRE